MPVPKCLFSFPAIPPGWLRPVVHNGPPPMTTQPIPDPEPEALLLMFQYQYQNVTYKIRPPKIDFPYT